MKLPNLLDHPSRAYSPIPFWFLNGDLDPEEIRRLLGISKNAFKRAAGRLLKQGKIGMSDGEIYRKNA